MGIKLDWEVESDGGWSEVGEDPGAIARREQRLRSLRNIAIGAAIVIVIAAAGLVWRLRQVGQEIESDLEATVAAETLALRLGDRRAFLDAQADVGEWVRIQDSTFASYEELGDRIEITGEILELDITADKARVVVQENLDGAPYRVIWYYQREPATGWLHIPPSSDFWGELITDKTSNLDIVYYAQDQELAALLKSRINGWWEIACRLTACETSPSRPTVRIEPDPLTGLGWAVYDDTTLIVPSPQRGRIPLDGSIDSALVDDIAEIIAAYWVDNLFAEALHPEGDLGWLQSELTLWLTGAFNQNVGVENFFDPLVQTYDTSFVRDFINEVAAGQAVIPTLNALTGTPVDQLQVNWGSYLGYRLRAESAMIANGFPAEANLLFRDVERADQATITDFPTEVVALPDTIEVTSTRQYNGLVWAEVQFAQIGDDAGSGPTVSKTFEPFRLVDNRWLHTYPLIEDWGEAQQRREGDILISYFELDSPSVDVVLPALAASYVEIAPDFARNGSVPLINVLIVPGSQGGLVTGLTVLRPRDLGQEEEVVQVTVASPYSTIRSAALDADIYIQQSAAQSLVINLVINHLGEFAANHPFSVAFMRWEMNRLGLDSDRAIAAFIDAQGRTSPPWPSDGIGFLAFSPAYSNSDYLSAYLLLEVMADAYGDEIIPVMMANLPLAADIDDWLMRSAGVQTDEISELWQAAFFDAIQDD